MKKTVPVVLFLFISTIYAQPTVESVDFHEDIENGIYNTGDIIWIEVQFSSAVSVTGTPTLTLETGEGGPFPADVVVNFSDIGSGTPKLRFNYTVETGHFSDDLDYVNVNSL